jgi:hypothetical protein
MAMEPSQASSAAYSALRSNPATDRVSAESSQDAGVDTGGISSVAATTESSERDSLLSSRLVRGLQQDYPSPETNEHRRSSTVPVSLPHRGPSSTVQIQRKPVPPASHPAAMSYPLAGVESGSRPRRSRLIEWWWWWEIGASVLSVAAVGGIILVLTRVANRSVLSPETWPYPIQPNSIIAVFSTISKSAMLVSVASCIGQLKWRHFHNRPNPLDQFQVFDDASRGPWGSLTVFFRLPARNSTLMVWLLALITVVALGFEPSVQQVLQVSSREVQLPNNTALMPTASSYSSRAFSATSV